MQLDDNLKQLMKELGAAINDALSESEEISEAIQNVRLRCVPSPGSHHWLQQTLKNGRRRSCRSKWTKKRGDEVEGHRSGSEVSPLVEDQHRRFGPAVIHISFAIPITSVV